jgi:hypothetical protein
MIRQVRMNRKIFARTDQRFLASLHSGYVLANALCECDSDEGDGRLATP